MNSFVFVTDSLLHDELCICEGKNMSGIKFLFTVKLFQTNTTSNLKESIYRSYQIQPDHDGNHRVW